MNVRSRERAEHSDMDKKFHDLEPNHEISLMRDVHSKISNLRRITFVDQSKEYNSELERIFSATGTKDMILHYARSIVSAMQTLDALEAYEEAKEQHEESVA